MSFVTTDLVAGHLKISDTAALQSHIDIAEIIIAAALGCSQLEERSVSEVVEVPRLRPTLPLPDGPIVGLSAFTKVQVSGESAMDLSKLKLTSYWSIGRDTLWPRFTEITVEYTAGFSPGDSATDSNLPARIQKAIILTAADLYQNPDKDKVSERIGDYAVQRAGSRITAEIDELPLNVSRLISPWRSPGVVF